MSDAPGIEDFLIHTPDPVPPAPPVTIDPIERPGGVAGAFGAPDRLPDPLDFPPPPPAPAAAPAPVSMDESPGELEPPSIGPVGDVDPPDLSAGPGFDLDPEPVVAVEPVEVARPGVGAPPVLTFDPSPEPVVPDVTGPAGRVEPPPLPAIEPVVQLDVPLAWAPPRSLADIDLPDEQAYRPLLPAPVLGDFDLDLDLTAPANDLPPVPVAPPTVHVLDDPGWVP